MSSRDFGVVILSSAAGKDIARLVRRIHREVPEARVVGVLCERRAGKALPARVSAFARKIWNREYLRYAAGRVVEGGYHLLLNSGSAVLRYVHGLSPRPETQEDLESVCGSLDCATFTTRDFHSEEALAFVRSLNADLGIVYGTRILKPSLFTIPRLGAINIHKRQVPDYRGGGPVGLWEMLDGQDHIGVTVHEVVDKLDAGAVVNAATISIEPFDTLTSLALKAHVIGNDLLVRSVADYARGSVVRTPQIGQGRMFKNPSPQQLMSYSKQLAQRRTAFQPKRGRSALNLLLRTVAALPMAAWRNRKRKRSGTFPVEILFHHIISDRPHDLGMSTEHFLRQVHFLRKFYNIVPLSEAIKMLESNRVTRPTVVLTFDDGYRDNFLTLRAIREQIDVPMTMFVSTDHIGNGKGFHHDIRRNRGEFAPLTWDQLRIMSDEGFEIGSHTQTHFDCGSTDLPALHREIIGSKQDLERKLGQPIDYFSFPFGLPKNMSPEAVKIAEENYKYVFSAYGGNNLPSSDGRVKSLRRWFHANDLWELELTLQSFLDAPKEPLADAGAWPEPGAFETASM